MARTKIEWTDWTCNCFWGCEQGCSYCSARAIARRFGRRIGEARGYDPAWVERMANFEPLFMTDQLDAIPAKPLKVFISEMGDWAGDWHLDLSREIMFDYIRGHPQHTFQLLTKQPQNLPSWSPFPENCWIGVTATNRAMYIHALRHLQKIIAKVFFICFEPLLETIMPNDFSSEVVKGLTDEHILQIFGINWLIIGQQTPITAWTTPKIEHIREIVEAADKAGIPVFLKDNLKPLLLNYEALELCPSFFKLDAKRDLRLRQEFPK